MYVCMRRRGGKVVLVAAYGVCRKLRELRVTMPINPERLPRDLAWLDNRRSEERVVRESPKIQQPPAQTISPRVLTILKL